MDLVPNFQPHELVCETVFNALNGNRQFILQLFNPKALVTLQAIRNKFGPTVLNTWRVERYGHSYRGFRMANCDVGATYSQHKLGNAFDCVFKHITVEEVREYILNHPEEFPHITAIEADVSWLHFDVRPGDWDGIKVFYP